jgi:glyoxylase-like metal-dependent hydrolase (beta-lactamase superfamily II)
MRIHCLSTGRVREKRRTRGVRRYLPGGWGAETLPVNVVAIEHPAGVCVFDTGQTARAARPGYFPRWYPFFRLARFELEPDDEAGAQLRRRGIDPARVRWVVLSHLHTDHAGGLAAFVRATLVVSAVEWRRAQGRPGRVRGYLPLEWPSGGPVVLVGGAAAPAHTFAWEHDLAGDGALTVVPTPGHTPGHVSLVVRDGARTLLLAGDAAHDRASLAREAPELAAWCERERATLVATHDDGACAHA